MDEENKPNYYAIIPAYVRYDNELPDKAKLLYGEISALANKTGECWASNKYFAELYSCSVRTITTLLTSLKEKDYIEINHIYRINSKEIEKRIIKLKKEVWKNISIGMEKNFHRGMEENFQGGMEKNFQDNNTSINNTSINNIEGGKIKNFTDTKRFIIPTLEEVQAYCTERNNKVDAEQFIDFYSSKGWYVGKNKMKDWKSAVRTWERRNSTKVVPPPKNYAEDIGLKVETINGVTGIWKI